MTYFSWPSFLPCGFWIAQNFTPLQRFTYFEIITNHRISKLWEGKQLKNVDFFYCTLQQMVSTSKMNIDLNLSSSIFSNLTNFWQNITKKISRDSKPLIVYCRHSFELLNVTNILLKQNMQHYFQNPHEK